MRALARIAAGLLLTAGILVVGFVTLSWAPDRPVSELKARWAPAPSTFVLVLPENGARFRHDIAGSRLVVFANLGHVPHEEDPAGTVVVVEHFLTGD